MIISGPCSGSLALSYRKTGFRPMPFSLSKVDSKFEIVDQHVSYNRLHFPHSGLEWVLSELLWKVSSIGTVSISCFY